MKKNLIPFLFVMFFLSTLWAGEIHEAAETGDLAKIRDLLKTNPQLLDNRDENGYTPLLMAAQNGHIEVYQYLKEQGADINTVNNRGSYALNLAASQGLLEMTKYLIKSGAEINRPTMRGFTPLIHACFSGKSEAAKILLDNGADMNVSDSVWGGCAIHWACNKGNDGTRDLLLSYGAELNKLSPADSSMPIFWAAYAGNLDALKWLIAHGISANTKDHDGWTPLHNAVRQGHNEVAKYLLDNGADFNAVSETGETPFLTSIYAENLEMTKLFLELGADVNIVNEHGQTPLQQAIFGQNLELIRLLIDNGADVNAASNNGTTALFNATYRENTEVTEVLINGGAQVNSCDQQGFSPLNNAIIQGYNDIAKLLLENNADLNLVDTIYNRTGLHLAAIKGNTEVTKMLLDKNARVNIKDKNGFTPLYYAGKYGHRDVAELLVDAGGTTKIVEKNYEWSPLLKKPIKDGEAYIWYLGHCGYAIKTSNNLLIFDYYNPDRNPSLPSLANGHINPEEIKNENVYFFVSHEHRDHIDSTILKWENDFKKCTYIFGFHPEDLDVYSDSGYAGPEYTFMAPRENKVIDNMEITTIEANDAGVGYLVKVDGLEIYHAGDHAGWRPGRQENFTIEIDFLETKISNLDFAFVNVTGCHVQDTISLAEGTKYTLEKLTPTMWFPTHGLNREYVYKRFTAKADNWNITSKAFCPDNRGDMILYNKAKGI